MRSLSVSSAVLLGFTIALLSPATSLAFSWRCLGCRGAVMVMRHLSETNATEHRILSVAEYVCEHFAVEDSTICAGILSQFRDSFFYVFRELLFRPSQLCGLMIGNNCGGSPHNPFDANWTVELPPRAERTPVAGGEAEKNKMLNVLQLSDFHFDLRYTPGAEAECHQPICCQKNSSSSTLSESKKRQKDVSARVTRAAGYWGTPGQCDLPARTIENMLEHISNNHQLDYILLSGDYMSHSDWTYTREDHLGIIDRLRRMLDKYFPETPIYWAIGNHEGVPVNSFAPHFAPPKFQPTWLYDAMANVSARFITSDAQSSLRFRGAYSVMVAENLKLITVNTGYCETTNFFLYINQTDPDENLRYLVDELYDCERHGRFAHIMAHIPPGDSECLEGWARNYYRIVNRFNDTIRGQFFGHVHTDFFTVFYANMNDAHSTPSGVLYTAPSVTTYGSLNPAYRIYTVANGGESAGKILDFHTYYLNLTAIPSPSKMEAAPQWELLYSAKDEYDMDDLSPQSWHDLSENIYNDLRVFSTFARNYARRDDFHCDSKCRKEILCALRLGHHNATALCPADALPATALVSSERRTRKKTMIKEGVNRVENSSLREEVTNALLTSTKELLWKKISGWIAAQS